MTSAIKSLIEAGGVLICPACDGDGEVGYFCGHDTFTDCHHCDGHGVIRSLNKQKHRKPCVICEGRKCLGGCDNRGYHEWESYELFEPKGTEVEP